MKRLAVLCLMVGIIGCGASKAGEVPGSTRIPGTIPCQLHHGTSMALNVDFQGVWTNPNAHSKVPAGAARRAENLVNPRPGVASTVAGQENLPGSYEESDERLSSGTSYQGCLVESTSGAAPRLYVRDPDSGTLDPFPGEIRPPTGVVRMPFAIAGDKLYMATAAGIQVMDGVGSTPIPVGVPEPYAPYLSLNTPGSGVAFILAPNESAAYRTVLQRADAKGAALYGAPSGRVFAKNTAGSNSQVTLVNYLPPGVAAGDKLRVFRTGKAMATETPGDAMYLVAEHIITSADLVAPYVQIVDTTPDELRGEPLYTNATQESILRQNERPPLAKDVAAFDDFLFAANVKGPERFQFRMLGTPEFGDAFTIAGQTYFCGLEDDFAAGAFTTVTADTVSESIFLTAQKLVRAINEKTTNTLVSAYYASGENDPPGIIQLEARDVSTASFAVHVNSGGTKYEPPLSTAQSSLATVEPNGLWLSKRGQHYAFPPLRSSSASYRYRVGVTGNPILKTVPLRESLIVFVSQEGVWRVKRTGAETWQAFQINNNAHLLVPDSVAVVDNQVLAWTTRGLVAVDDSGVEEIDLPIKDQIEAIHDLGDGVVLPYTFGIGDEARLRYTLYHPTSTTSTSAAHAWVYNVEQQTWTERTDPASGGFVSKDNGLLYLGSTTLPTLTQERTGTALQRYKTPANTGIPVRLQWTVMDDGDPGAEKQYAELRLLTADPITGPVTFSCTNDLGGAESTTGTTSTDVNGEPFVRAWVPDGCQRTSRLKVDIQRSVLGQAFEVVGMKTLTADMFDGAMTR